MEDETSSLVVDLLTVSHVQSQTVEEKKELRERERENEDISYYFYSLDSFVVNSNSLLTLLGPLEFTAYITSLNFMKAVNDSITVLVILVSSTVILILSFSTGQSPPTNPKLCISMIYCSIERLPLLRGGAHDKCILLAVVLIAVSE